jgi:translation initiation factor eIF-2B subunit delta
MQPMSLHPSVKQVVRQLQAAELHAARSGREVMRVLTETVIDSQSLDLAEFDNEIETAVQAILLAMPAYAPPLNAVCRFIACLETGLTQGDTLADLKTRLIAESEAFQRLTQIAPQRITTIASELISPKMTIYTHTLSETVMRSLTGAWKNNIQFRVLVSESQPNCDGWETARQLAKLGIEVRLGIDASMGDLVTQADMMLTGAEAITPQGTAICKVGTYLAALAAHEVGIPYFVLADTLKFIPPFVAGFLSISDRVVLPDFSNSRKAEGFELVNQLFDETPAKLIAGVVTEQGIISPLACGTVNHKELANDRLIRVLSRAGIITKSLTV